MLLLAMAASWSKIAAYEFKPVLGKQVTMSHKKVGVCALAGLLVLYLGGSLLLSATGVASTVILAHSACRQTPEGEVEYQPPKLTV